MNTFLIIQTASIGDVILSTAMANAIVSALPKAKVDYLIKKGNEGIFDNNPNVRKLYVWDKKKGKYKNMRRILSQIRATKYDAVFNLQRFLSSGIFSVCSGAKQVYGFKKNPLSFLFTQSFEHNYQDHWHETKRNHQLIRHLCGERVAKPQLFPSAEAESKLSWCQTQTYITITPASLWFTKQYPKDQWVDFICKLPQDVYVYLLGGKADIPLCQKIVEATPHSRIEIMAGKLSITESAVLMRSAQMNYVNDSAAQHIASAMNAPTTTLYCSTIPNLGFGPLSDDSVVIETPENLACRPCGLHGHKSCPQQHFKCATTISTHRLIERYEQSV